MKNSKKAGMFLIAAILAIFAISCSKEDLSQFTGQNTSATEVKHGADDPADVGDDHGGSGTETGDDHGGHGTEAGDDHGGHHGGGHGGHHGGDDDSTGHH